MARPIDADEKVNEEKLESVPEIHYLGNILSLGCGCELASPTHCKNAGANCFPFSSTAITVQFSFLRVPRGTTIRCKADLQILSFVYSQTDEGFNHKSGVLNMCEGHNGACDRDWLGS